MSLNVVIFGAPGSGKGTQSIMIAEKFGLKHLSTGDLLRAEQEKGSELGQKIAGFTSQGNLVPDALIIDMLANVLDEQPTDTGFIFDGFPRTVAQAQALKEMLAKRNKGVSIMLDLMVDENELVKRLLNRGLTSGRADDNEETIQRRIQVYHSKTAPVKDFYKQEGLSTDIAGLGAIDEIFARICAAIEAV